MTKSKNARRNARRRQSNLSMPYARHRPINNWQVGSQAVNSVGAVYGGVSSPTSVPSWNPAGGAVTPMVLASGSPVTFQVGVIQPAVTGNIPTLGRLQIDELKGHIHFSAPSANSYFSIAVAVYVSEFTISTSAWDVYDPLVPSDGARDDFFFLNSMVAQFVTSATSTADSSVAMDIGFRGPIVIGGGQALNVTVSMSNGNTATLVCSPAFRIRVGPVS